MFLRVSVVLALTLVSWVVIFQMILPLWQDKLIFPILRRKTKKEKLQKELQKLEEYADELELRHKVSEKLFEVINSEPLPSKKEKDHEHEQQ